MRGRINKHSERLVEAEVDGEAVVMDLASGDFYSLQDSALAIWRLVDGSRDGAAILAALAREYQVAPKALASDVDAFLDQAIAAGLLDPS